jgi:hypothetical protein
MTENRAINAPEENPGPLLVLWRTLKKWWMAFAHGLGWVNTRLILTVFYIVIIGIPAIILKLIGKDLLHRKYSKAPSYWIKKEPLQHSLEQAKHQF